MNKTTSTTLALILPLFAGVSCAQSEFSNWEEALSVGGLSAAEAYLADQDPTAESAFVLGGVRFLSAFESAFQVRYANFTGELPIVPGMAARLPPNPNASFAPEFFETAMTDVLNHMAAAEQALETATAGEFAIELRLEDFWFDIDADGERDAFEGLMEIMAEANSRPGVAEFDGAIRFDTADAEWLLAYVHAVSGMAEFALSLDPTPAIRTVYEGREMLASVGAIGETPFVGDDTVLDTIAAVLLTLQGVPDSVRTRAAHAHFKAMIAHNRIFWEKVEQETDDDREWLPNANQTAAIGLAVTDGTALAWREVLDDIDAILDGELLIPYWRVARRPGSGGTVGLNFRRLMENPNDMDIILWIQGTAAAPFLEQGQLADMDAWGQFLSMTPGNSMLYAIWFN
jgi:hypothetical protein